MGSKTITSFLRIFFLLFLQALVVSRLQLLDGFVLPWVYIFGILMLPFDTPKWLGFDLGFCYWLLHGSFYRSYGHAHDSLCGLGLVATHGSTVDVSPRGLRCHSRAYHPKNGIELVFDLCWNLDFLSSLCFVLRRDFAHYAILVSNRTYRIQCYWNLNAFGGGSVFDL